MSDRQGQGALAHAADAGNGDLPRPVSRREPLPEPGQLLVAADKLRVGGLGQVVIGSRHASTATGAGAASIFCSTSAISCRKACRRSVLSCVVAWNAGEPVPPALAGPPR